MAGSLRGKGPGSRGRSSRRCQCLAGVSESRWEAEQGRYANLRVPPEPGRHRAPAGCCIVACTALLMSKLWWFAVSNRAAPPLPSWRLLAGVLLGVSAHSPGASQRSRVVVQAPRTGRSRAPANGRTETQAGSPTLDVKCQVAPLSRTMQWWSVGGLQELLPAAPRHVAPMAEGGSAKVKPTAVDVLPEFRSLDTSACPIDSHPTTLHSAAWHRLVGCQFV